MTLRRWVLLLICVAAAACSGAPDSTPAPTLALIPGTATATPTPEPPTPTPEPLTQPQDLFTTPTAPVLPDGTPESLIDIDPIAAELVTIAQRFVARARDLPTSRVRLVEVGLYEWTDSSLGCPAPGQTYTPVETRGYRILLNAGDEEYLFHTDFDRVLPCDPDNERLPIEATPEVTAEFTEDATEDSTAEAAAE